jgi:hypothetical protein
VVALAVVATVWAIGQNHRWVRGANRACAHEQAQLATLRGLGPIDLERKTLLDEEAVAALKRLDSRTRAEKNYIAWREYEVKLEVWIAGERAAGRDASRGINALSSARESSRKRARWLGAKACARA